jgi:hypothetical protein
VQVQVQVLPQGGVAESSLGEEMRLEQKARRRASARLAVPEEEVVVVVPVQLRLALLQAGSELSWAIDPREWEL